MSKRETRWRIETDRGTLRARMLVAGRGPLTEPKVPDLPGLETFEGHTMHSARWDHDNDLTGKRVASIGTGASAIQYVPEIQPDVEQLHVFQRTPPWIFPPQRPAHHGAAVAGFPNLFMLLGPNTGLGHDAVAGLDVPLPQSHRPIRPLGVRARATDGRAGARDDLTQPSATYIGRLPWQS